MRWLLYISLAAVSAYANPGTYVVLAPAKYTPGMDLSISVNILNATSPTVVTASLDGLDTLSVGNFQQGQPDTLTIQVPESTRGGKQLKVVGSGGVNFTESTYVYSGSKTFSTYIQTNKGTYKPSDTVKFRALSVNPDLSIIDDKMDIMIFDSEGNRIKQWLASVPSNGVVTKEIKLSLQPVLGTWKIRVQREGQHSFEDKEFVVAEYVLPKFEVTVDMPSYAVSTAADVTFKVKAKYTYGKNLKGKVDVSAKLHYSYQSYDTSTSAVLFNTKVDIDGETSISIPMSTFTTISKTLANRKLSVIANVTEELTGNQMSDTGSVDFYDKDYKLEFPKSNPETFKPGLRYTGYMLLTQPDGLPYGNGQETVEAVTTLTREDTTNVGKTTPPRYPWMFKPTPTIREVLPAVTLTVGQNGLVEVPLDVPIDVISLFTTVKYKDSSAQLSLKKSHSPSDSYMQIVKTTDGTPNNGDSVSFEIRSTQPVESFVYQILSRGSVVATQGLDANSQTTFAFSLTVTDKMAPNARIIAYYVRDDGEIVTDSISFDVSGVFKNKVSVGVNLATAEPGQEVEVTVTSDPNSQAHLLAIDQSVLLLRSGNDITAADVNADLKKYDGGSNPQPVHDFIWWGGSFTYSGKDASQVFDNAGVKVLTDGLVYTYVDPQIPLDMLMSADGMDQVLMEAGRAPQIPGQSQSSSSNGASMSAPKLRTDFSETWIWNAPVIGADGKVAFNSSVPDTITSWVLSAFAVNQQSGFGVAPTTASLKVFRPFFVSLNLPYSVIRGEHVALQAIVFNYMDTDMQVRVTLAKSENFFNVIVDATGSESYKQEERVQDVLVKAGEAKSVYFPIVAADLGKIDIEVKAQSSSAGDALKRQLLVEAEGVPKEYNVPVLVDLTGNATTFQTTVDLTMPPLVVQGSELTRVTAVGDMMGPSIAGLDELLRMPTGCGEQTMIGLAPDVYITDYLSALNKLDGETADKALGYMESGYQRELTYKHTDNSFSAFGNSDDSGSMWLTAFVSRVFHQAKRHIDVDEQVIKRAITWMIQKQNANGSFPEPGRVIHKNMQGKAATGTGLSLFVFISLLENEDLYTAPSYETTRYNEAKSKALAYLEQEVTQTDDVYVLALAAYAFQLAKSGQAQAVLNKLEQKAIVKDGLKYWHVPEEPSSKVTGSWHPPNPSRAVDTEVTAYVLLTYADQQDIVAGRNVMQWVAKQRNPQGGFSSTQDTVVALNALSEFARLTYSDNFNVQIKAELNATTAYDFSVNATNALVLQSRETKSVPAQVKVSASGHGMALLQVAVFFNVESEVEDLTFDLAVTLLEDTLNRLTIRTCSKWRGDGSASGMAVQELGIPSGFAVDPESVPTHKLLKRFEFQDKKVILYFDEISQSGLCLDFVAERVGLVAKSQAVAVRVFDYYEPTNQMTAFYQSQKLKDANVCDVCLECDNCAAARRR